MGKNKKETSPDGVAKQIKLKDAQNSKGPESKTTYKPGFGDEVSKPARSNVKNDIGDGVRVPKPAPKPLSPQITENHRMKHLLVTFRAAYNKKRKSTGFEYTKLTEQWLAELNAVVSALNDAQFQSTFELFLDFMIDEQKEKENMFNDRAIYQRASLVFSEELYMRISLIVTTFKNLLAYYKKKKDTTREAIWRCNYYVLEKAKVSQKLITYFSDID
ncbi:MAG: hypothetical protein GY804_08525 [Alphaproteobacteria bacterium]|nr:hypothetical protein [Alphaproteobacteria bacterium]